MLRIFLIPMTLLLLASLPVGAQSLQLEDALRDKTLSDNGVENSRLFQSESGDTDNRIAQRGMTLPEAIESVRRRGNVERIISAQTRVSGGREVHYIKVLTKDHTVQTHKVPGRNRN